MRRTSRHDCCRFSHCAHRRASSGAHGGRHCSRGHCDGRCPNSADWLIWGSKTAVARGKFTLLEGGGCSVVSTVRVAVVDDHEIFRRGVVACLSEHPRFDVVFEGEQGPIDCEADVAVTSARAAGQTRLPVVVCSDHPGDETLEGTRQAILPRARLTPDQLAGAVAAVAAGLSIRVQQGPAEKLNERGRLVLSLLAEGAGTREIADEVGYSERTIKNVIHQIETELGARNRVEAVALGIRAGII